MPLLAILLDILTLGAYWLQVDVFDSGLTLIGFVFQIAMVLILFLVTIDYQGPRVTRYRPAGYGYLTIRYGLIIMSFVINAIVLFLYGLAYFKINDVLFHQVALLILK
ncbi:hypothetical protein [Lapidilactobacillus wuchangensis]|uniref:hypothetical protein n=1 Tax=Lapidilactobacillus wuchangensis TaxID=2486001 RepID=UPI000F7A0CB2|nr:hypothetical protein [Lapidilactobacillus wuchangensis]